MFVHYDYEQLASKLLTEQERKILEGLDIRLCVDKEYGTIHHEVCADKVHTVEDIREEDKVIGKFINLLLKEMKFYA